MISDLQQNKESETKSESDFSSFHGWDSTNSIEAVLTSNLEHECSGGQSATGRRDISYDGTCGEVATSPIFSVSVTAVESINHESGCPQTFISPEGDLVEPQAGVSGPERIINDVVELGPAGPNFSRPGEVGFSL